jgi:hypothetical protein
VILLMVPPKDKFASSPLLCSIISCFMLSIKSLDKGPNWENLRSNFPNWLHQIIVFHPQATPKLMLWGSKYKWALGLRCYGAIGQWLWLLAMVISHWPLIMAIGYSFWTLSCAPMSSPITIVIITHITHNIKIL